MTSHGRKRREVAPGLGLLLLLGEVVDSDVVCQVVDWLSHVMPLNRSIIGGIAIAILGALTEAQWLLRLLEALVNWRVLLWAREDALVLHWLLDLLEASWLLLEVLVDWLVELGLVEVHLSLGLEAIVHLLGRHHLGAER
jgi:hypothetical protein